MSFLYQADRRRLIKYAFAGVCSGLTAGCGMGSSTVSFVDYPFKLGVASGDPLSDGFVLWTRLAPNPLDVRAMAREPVVVGWEIALDDGFRSIVQAGTEMAYPELAHSVHVEVSGLLPARDYFYRFHAGDMTSDVGRARTAPLLNSALETFRFALCCCQSYSDGFYGAYRDLAAAAPDLVVHVGDYIYEKPWTTPARRMPTPEAITLDDYRAYHATTKLDPHLQAAHAAAPWLVIWDDHEVANDYRGANAPEGSTPEQFMARRRAAYQAYYEHMPLRRRARPVRGGMQIYQRSGFGNLVQFDMLDTRQYRSDHPCRGPERQTPGWITCKADDPARTMLGGAQEKWFSHGYGVLKARWNIIVQTTQMTDSLRNIDGAVKYSSDRWSAYPAARDRLLDVIQARGAENPVVLGGDIHAFFASALHDSRSGEAVATELVCGAISSGGGGETRYSEETAYYNSLNHPFYFENRTNGYLLCTVRSSELTAEVRAIDSVLDPNSPVRTLKKINIEAGRVGPVMT